MTLPTLKDMSKEDLLEIIHSMPMVEALISEQTICLYVVNRLIKRWNSISREVEVLRPEIKTVKFSKKMTPAYMERLRRANRLIKQANRVGIRLAELKSEYEKKYGKILYENEGITP